MKLLLTSCTILMLLGGCKDPGQKKVPAQTQHAPRTDVQIADGTWADEQDTQSTVIISKGEWTFHYQGEEDLPGDVFHMTFTDRVPEASQEKGHYLVLANAEDTMQFELLEAGEKEFSVLHLSSGKIHVYRQR